MGKRTSNCWCGVEKLGHWGSNTGKTPNCLTTKMALSKISEILYVCTVSAQQFKAKGTEIYWVRTGEKAYWVKQTPLLVSAVFVFSSRHSH